MIVPMISFQIVTREAVKPALVSVLRERNAVKVAVLCAKCGADTEVWLHETDEVVPYTICSRCDAALDHDLS